MVVLVVDVEKIEGAIAVPIIVLVRVAANSINKNSSSRAVAGMLLWLQL